MTPTGQKAKTFLLEIGKDECLAVTVDLCLGGNEKKYCLPLK